MPGPKSTPNGTVRKGGEANRKIAKRLAARKSQHVPNNSQNGQAMHMPGSQNRNK